MTVTRVAMFLTFLVLSTAVLSGWVNGTSTWAASCPQHRGVTDKVGAVNDQTQALPIPPSQQQHGQAGTQTESWEKGVVGAVILAATIFLGLLFHRQQKAGRGSYSEQLSLPYSATDPIPVTQAG